MTINTTITSFWKVGKELLLDGHHVLIDILIFEHDAKCHPEPEK